MNWVLLLWHCSLLLIAIVSIIYLTVKEYKRCGEFYQEYNKLSDRTFKIIDNNFKKELDVFYKKLDLENI